MLGVPVAKITCTQLPKEQLAQILQRLKLHRIKLVYWASDSQHRASQEAAQACGGFLVDEKITYCLDLACLTSLSIPPNVTIYPDLCANAELQALALEISKFSRFSRDPHLPSEAVKKLYTAWINNACKKIVAHVILVTKLQNHIVGMVVIDEKKGRGDLSLLAVDPQHQGIGLGKRLVCAALAWCFQHDYAISQVVTQKENINACRLYERCGFRSEKSECFYHFWL